MSDILTYESPPVAELGLTIVPASGRVYDPYDVAGLHAVYSDRFPHAELQASIAALQAAPLVGGVPGAPDQSQKPPARWWFVSEQGERVLQLQDDWLSLNWRRDSTPEPAAYPGYDALLLELKDLSGRLGAWHTSRGVPLSDPVGCEIMYENHVSMSAEDGGVLPLSTVLAEVAPIPDIPPRANYSLSWFEQIGNEGARSIVLVTIQTGGFLDPKSGTIQPILRLNFVAGAALQGWEQAFTFFNEAHAHIRSRFVALIRPEVRAKWGERREVR